MDIIQIAETYSQKNKKLTETIIKEFLHYEILKILYKNNKTKESLVFQGGTALRLCYNGTRFSEDLDFCIANNKEFDFNIMKEFSKDFIDIIYQKYGLQVEVKNLKANKTDDIIQKWATKIFMPLPKEQRTPVINIEIARINSYEHIPMETIKNYKEVGQETIVLVETMEEILADKIIAFGDREYLKHRDIWDIHFLNNQKVRLEADLILKKIQDYHIDNLVEKLKERVKILNLEESKKNFYSEISRFISAERFEEIKSWDYYEIIKRTTQQIISIAIDEIVLINQSNYFNPNSSSALDSIKAEELAKSKAIKSDKSETKETIKSHNKNTK